MPEKQSGKVRIELGGVQETLLIALWFRARENQRPNPVLLDPKASEIIRELDYDFSRMERSLAEHIVLSSTISSRYCDEAIRSFTARHPGAAVVNLGAGLDTTFYRVDNGLLSWYDLDLPEAIGLRKRLIPETDRSRCIAKSIFDLSWFDEIRPAGEGVFMFAHAVFCYLDPADLRRLFSALATRFPGSEMIFNSYNMIGRSAGNHLAIRRTGIKDAPLKWALGSARQLPKWDSRIEIVDEWRLFSRVRRDPTWKRSTILVMDFSNWFGLQSMIHLRLR